MLRRRRRRRARRASSPQTTTTTKIQTKISSRGPMCNWSMGRCLTGLRVNACPVYGSMLDRSTDQCYAGSPDDVSTIHGSMFH